MSGNPPTFRGSTWLAFFPSGWLGKSQELIFCLGGDSWRSYVSPALGARWNPSDFQAGSGKHPVFQLYTMDCFFRFFGWWNLSIFLLEFLPRSSRVKNSIHLKGFPRSDGFCHWVLSFLLGFPDSSDPRVDTVSSDTPILSWQIACLGWWFQIFFCVHPDPRGNDPNWLYMFQTGWNHQLKFNLMEYCTSSYIKVPRLCLWRNVFSNGTDSKRSTFVCPGKAKHHRMFTEKSSP